MPNRVVSTLFFVEPAAVGCLHGDADKRMNHSRIPHVPGALFQGSPVSDAHQRSAFVQLGLQKNEASTSESGLGLGFLAHLARNLHHGVDCSVPPPRRRVSCSLASSGWLRSGAGESRSRCDVLLPGHAMLGKTNVEGAPLRKDRAAIAAERSGPFRRSRVPHRRNGRGCYDCGTEQE